MSSEVKPNITFMGFWKSPGGFISGMYIVRFGGFISGQYK